MLFRSARHFAEGLEEVLVVEEKRALIENQFKEQLYNWRADVRPRVVGKFDENRDWVLPSADELAPAQIARVIARRLKPFYTSPAIEERLAFLEAKEKALAKPHSKFKRVPYFCSGCPHNTSTKLPEGSRALAGIGCHFMASWMERGTQGLIQMGGEGVDWVSHAMFTKVPRVFQNLGDGTYYHSGYLAIRQAVAAGATLTYKILFNDAVAMTGGQPVDGVITVDAIARQVESVGVAKASTPTTTLLLLAMLAGAFISLGALFFTVVVTQSTLGMGVTRLLGGLAFCLGLVLVVVAGAELFTGNNLLAMAWASGRIGTGAIVRNWALAYLGNVIGCVGTVTFVLWAGTAKMAGGAVGTTAIEIARAKALLPPGEAFARGVLCNALVCLAVWLTLGGRTVSDKILAILFPIAAFVTMG